MTLTEFMAVKIGIEEYLMEKSSKIFETLKVKSYAKKVHLFFGHMGHACLSLLMCHRALCLVRQDDRIRRISQASNVKKPTGFIGTS